MSHPEQVGFFQAVVEANKTLIDGASVLEMGSYDVNGNVRSVFAAAGRYVGVDLVAGPGVDVVGFGHQVDHPDGSYDVTISGECFEHDPQWRETFLNMVRMTRPGGLVVFSCASRGRPEHGTTRTNKTLSPGTQAIGINYYRNLVKSDFESTLPLGSMFDDHRFWSLRTHFDLYFAGIRTGQDRRRDDAQLPDDAAVQRLQSLMPLKHKLVRAPLRLLSRIVPEPQYQSVILPYWNTLLRLAPSQQRQPTH
ncbi:class I SAM-dependent methyltransferase [Mycobacterium haemophilum]|uniref:class I SAM-dependent methyltransferase n=1 Tax=Mycobacterium haemophilum TaxID=29311 RepID=UPI000699FEF2|nr:methyltransferase domain-containing protein [Mycobacterium haemophilum]